MRSVSKFKCYTRYKEDLWFELLYKKDLKSLRKLAEVLYLKKAYRRASDKELILSLIPSPAMKKRSNRAPSRYKKQLLDKQKLQNFYTVLKDYQFKNFLKKASHMQGFIEENFLQLLESRLGTVLVRAGFCKTTVQARQYVGHYGVFVEGCLTNRFNQLLKVGETLMLSMSLLTSVDTGSNFGYPSTYLEVNYTTLSVTLFSTPKPNSVPFPFNYSVSDVVSYYY